MALYDAITRAVAGAVGLVSPGAALRYVHQRQTLARVAGYGGARRDGPSGRNLPQDGNINFRNARDRAILQARARQLVDDNPNVSGAIDKICANVVGTGINPQAQLLGRDGQPFDAANDSIEKDFADWAKRVEWREKQELTLRHCWMDGGCLMHLYPRPDLRAEGLVPLGVELLTLDSLDTNVNGKLPNGNCAFRGIEVNLHREPVAFHVRRAKDGDLDGFAIWSSGQSQILGTETERLPAPFCTLITRKRRIGQLLPVSWMHAIIQTMHDLDEYQSSERIAARLCAAFGVFVLLPEGPQGNDLSGNPLPALTGGVDTMQRIISGREFIGQGRIDALPPGADIKFAAHNRPGETYAPFVRGTQRSAATALGMSGESFSGDYTEASYSSVRQAVLEERRGYRLMQQFVVERQNQPLWDIWTAFRADFMRGDRVIPVRWERPGWSWVDPQKDANAAKTRVELGVVSRRLLCEEQGLDYDDIRRQLAQEEKFAKTAGDANAKTQEAQ